ncbi:DUF6386 family protein [Proteus vulgaris]
MLNVFSFTTDTATLAIFDLQAIHRKSDTADWWSILDDEIGENE